MRTCATSNTINCWEDIDFSEAEKRVKKLQKRMALAYLHGCYDKVAMLQNTLMHSFYAKALAVKVVTSNRGKYTTGIDNTLWITSADKFDAIFTLTRRGYKSKPMKRVYIPKPNGKTRPLSIPTMKDRAMQTLYKFALEPIAELTADDCSFAFRPKRSARDAIIKCIDILSDAKCYDYMLKVDIKSCFDNISHEWILENIPIDKNMLMSLLECGYMYKSVFYISDKGVPQGSCLSCVVANMVLDGLDELIASSFGDSVRVVRYADDIMLFGTNKAILVQSAITLVKEFLAERGLCLSMEKTMLYNIDNGASFLGWKLYKENNQIFAVAEKNKIDSLINRIGRILNGIKYTPIDIINQELNMLIRGWFNYYRGIASEYFLYGVEFEIVSFVNELNVDSRIADYINKLFFSIIEEVK